MSYDHPDFERPPAVEAYIELVFSDPLSDAEIRRGADAISKDEYPHRSQENGLEVRLSVAGPPQVEKTGTRWVLQDASNLQRVVVQQASLIFLRLAPYPGWNVFFEAAWKVFSRVRAKWGYRKLQRVGVRFVNRLDLPDGPDGAALLDDYITVSPSAFPLPGLERPKAYFSQSDYQNVLGASVVIVRSGTQEAAIIGHSSILLDIDVQQHQVPAAEADLQKLINELREVKNSVFMASITPKAQTLFNPRK